LLVQREIDDDEDWINETPIVTTEKSSSTNPTTESFSRSPFTTPRVSERTTLKPSGTTEISSTHDKKPDLCTESFDTISFIRNEIFLFKGKVNLKTSSHCQ